jgi:hypothetical protein
VYQREHQAWWVLCTSKADVERADFCCRQEYLSSLWGVNGEINAAGRHLSGMTSDERMPRLGKGRPVCECPLQGTSQCMPACCRPCVRVLTFSICPLAVAVGPLGHLVLLLLLRHAQGGGEVALYFRRHIIFLSPDFRSPSFLAAGRYSHTG